MVEHTTLGSVIAPAKVIRCGKQTFPVLSMTMHDGIMLQSERFKKSLASIDQSDYKVVKRGQLVVGFPIDEGVLYVQKAADEGIMSPAYNVWNIDTKKIDSDFLELCLHSPQAMQFYKSKLRGTTARRRSIPTDELLSLKIPLPDLPTQRRIAATLDAVTTLIAKRHQQLDALDQLVKARFVEMFGDPVRNPKHWPKASLSEIISNANNGMARRGNDAEGNIVLRLVELQNGFIDYSSPNRVVLTEVEKKRYLLKNGDFLFARVNGNPENVGRCAEFSDIGEPVYHNDHIIRVHFDENTINGCFASVLLNSTYGKKQMANQIKTSAGQYTISQEGIGAIVAVLPPLELQNQFAAFVTQVDHAKTTVQQSLQSLETLKKSLMQQYFG